MGPVHSSIFSLVVRTANCEPFTSPASDHLCFCMSQGWRLAEFYFGNGDTEHLARDSVCQHRTRPGTCWTIAKPAERNTPAIDRFSIGQTSIFSVHCQASLGTIITSYAYRLPVDDLQPSINFAETFRSWKREKIGPFFRFFPATLIFQN